MAQYIICYIGGAEPTTPEEGKQHFARYNEWLTEMGDAVVNPASPFKDTATVQSDGTVEPGSMSAISGFTVIEADDIEVALEHAKACPFLELGGALEVSELIQMPG